MMDPPIFERIRKDLLPIKDQIPKDTILICERIAYQDEDGIVVTTIFFLARATDDPHTYANISHGCEVNLWVEENAEELRATLQTWLKIATVVTVGSPCKIFTKRKLENQEVFIPDTAPSYWAMADRRLYTFQRVF